MRQDAGKGTRTGHCRYKHDYDRQVCSTPRTIEIWQLVYLDFLLMTTSAAFWVATGAPSKELSIRTGLFEGIEVSPTTVTIFDEGIQNTVSTNWATQMPLTKHAEEMKNTRQANPSTNETTKGTQRRSNYCRRTRSLSISPCVMWVEGPASNTFCTDTVTRPLTMNDLVEPGEHIPEHFINHLCGWVQKEHARRHERNK